MKKPDKIIKWFSVTKKKDDIWVDFNGKSSYSYFIEIPYWLGRAYKLGTVNRAKIEFRTDVPCLHDQEREETKKDYKQYFKENWSDKITKMRKMNYGYMLVASTAKGTGWFKSLEDYNKYHSALNALNKKYGVNLPEAD